MALPCQCAAWWRNPGCRSPVDYLKTRTLYCRVRIQLGDERRQVMTKFKTIFDFRLIRGPTCVDKNSPGRDFFAWTSQYRGHN